jgi:hypothetical protein
MSLSSTEIKEIRKFGTIAFVFFGFLAALVLWREKFYLIYVFGFLSLVGLGLLIFPSPFSPAYNMWLKIAHFIGRIITGLILTLAYYLVVTPSAVLKRLFGGRPLPMRPDPYASSYWVPRSEPVQPKERFEKRF